MSSEGQVTQAVDGHVLRIGIDRPEKRNSLTPEMMRGLADAFDRLQNDPDLRAGVLYGVGGNFTSGLDLPKFVPVMSGAAPAPVYEGIDPLQLKNRLTKPLIGAASGFVFTVGIELLLGCDVVVAADDAVFGQLEPSRGIMPSGGATVRWVQQVGWGNAMRYLLTAERFGSAEALRIGLVQEVTPNGSELSRAMAIAASIARNAPLAVQATKASALLYLSQGEQSAFSALGKAQAALAKSEDVMEGVAAMTQRRDPEFRGR